MPCAGSFRCKKRSCKYRAALTMPYGCEYLSITGHSRIKGLVGEERDPENCPYYEKRGSKKDGSTANATVFSEREENMKKFSFGKHSTPAEECQLLEIRDARYGDVYFGDIMKEHLKQAGWNQIDLSEISGVPYKSIGNYGAQSLSRNPLLKNAVMIAHAFGLTLDEFLSHAEHDEKKHFVDAEEVTEIFKARVREGMQRRHMSEKQFKRYMVLRTRSALVYKEDVKSRISLNTAIRVANVLGCSIDYLCGEEDWIEVGS